MIAINRNEKDIIAAQYPQLHIVRTMKGDSKRQHYYMEEAAGPMRLLRKLRGQPDERPRKAQKGQKGRGRDYDRQKTRRDRV